MTVTWLISYISCPNWLIDTKLERNFVTTIHGSKSTHVLFTRTFDKLQLLMHHLQYCDFFFMVSEIGACLLCPSLVVDLFYMRSISVNTYQASMVQLRRLWQYICHGFYTKFRWSRGTDLCIPVQILELNFWALWTWRLSYFFLTTDSDICGTSELVKGTGGCGAEWVLLLFFSTGKFWLR